MKGIVFTEFIEMVESKFGLETADDILSNSELESGGAYTAVGTYDFSEMLTLLGALSKKSGIKIPVLLETFGEYLFNTFARGYSQMFERCKDSFDFIESIENHIHIEVRKLYDDAQLPTFETIFRDEKELKMIYRSERKMADFAKGLLTKTMEYYADPAMISYDLIKPDGSEVCFTIRRAND